MEAKVETVVFLFSISGHTATNTILNLNLMGAMYGNSRFANVCLELEEKIIATTLSSVALVADI